MSYYWLSVALKTGDVLADLPLLSCEKVSKQIGALTTSEAALPVVGRGTPENWLRATLPGGSALVLLDTATDTPVWGGMVTRRQRSTGDTVALSLATIEAYLDRRFVGDRSYRGADQNTIVSDLVARFVATGSNGGLPIRTQTTGSGVVILRDRDYADISDKTVLSALQELMGVEGGAEFTADWEWSAGRLTPVLTVGDRIGSAPTPGLFPAATFEVPGPVREAELSEDYASDSGANDVMAVSSADADQRPQSRHVVTLDPDRPTFENRFSPSTSITDTATLDAHAASMAAILASGEQALSLASATKDAPRVGVDWIAGDDLGFVVGGLDRFGRELVPAFPGGLTGVARSVGWVLEFQSTQAPETITPVLQDPSEEA